jgi:hypothetical protein
MKSILRTVLLLLIVSLAIFFFVRYSFVFGEGTKAGEMNFFVKKGYIFKTFEGRLIQTGYKSQVPGAIQSNELSFQTDEK